MKKKIKPLVLKCRSKKGSRLQLEMVIDIGSNGNMYSTDLQKEMSLNNWLERHCMRQTTLGKKSVRQIVCVTRMAAACGSRTIRLADTDAEFCKNLVTYMRSEYRTAAGKKLCAYTVINYLRCFTHAMNEAVREGVIDYNPMSRLNLEDKVKTPGRQIKYLSIDEVKKLIKSGNCQDKVKRAFLFSCFCGLRFSDVSALTWENVKTSGNARLRIELTVRKTGMPLTVYLSDEACKWLPERKDITGNVFQLPSAVWVNKILKRWGKSAGIDKRLTFHVARHTFATMMLTLGADLYTTSKLLGHSSIKTTQIYAQIVDKKKEEAVNLVNGLF